MGSSILYILIIKDAEFACYFWCTHIMPGREVKDNMSRNDVTIDINNESDKYLNTSLNSFQTVSHSKYYVTDFNIWYKHERAWNQ